jgi:thiazolylpeptide-type bacteriocin precursor
MDSQFEMEIQSKLSMQEELRALDTETFEIEDLADLGQDAALAPPACWSCSCTSCSCCSSSCSG